MISEKSEVYILTYFGTVLAEMFTRFVALDGSFEQTKKCNRDGEDNQRSFREYWPSYITVVISPIPHVLR